MVSSYSTTFLDLLSDYYNNHLDSTQYRSLTKTVIEESKIVPDDSVIYGVHDLDDYDLLKHPHIIPDGTINSINYFGEIYINPEYYFLLSIFMLM